MSLLHIVNLLLVLALLLLLRKLIWCLSCLWRYHRGQSMPEPQHFLPRQSGSVFDRHMENAREARGNAAVPEPADPPEEKNL